MEMAVEKALSEEREPMGCRNNQCPYVLQATGDGKHSLENRFAILRRILFYFPGKKIPCFHSGKELALLETFLPPSCLDHPGVPRGRTDPNPSLLGN